MSSPRVYFTATVLVPSGYIVIAGGTADDSTPLSTVDIYNPVTGCYNLSNISSQRMKHTAVEFNNSDTVLLIGGVTPTPASDLLTECISLSSAQYVLALSGARYLHETAVLTNKNILVVGGQSTQPTVPGMYSRNTNTFWPLEHAGPTLWNVEGHSVTSLESNNNALIFGGFNGGIYLNQAWMVEGIDGNSTDISQRTSHIYSRAHHQATYVPNVDKVLITGGDNGTHTFDSCFLYSVADGTFNRTGSMQMKRSYHAAVRLANGSVLVIGGIGTFFGGQASDVLKSVERYDVSTGTFTFVTNLNVPRYGHKAVVVSQNQVFVFGGYSTDGVILSSIEYLFPE